LISETRDTRPGVTPRLFEIREGTRTNRSAHQGKVSSWAPKLRRSAPGRRPGRLFEAGVAIKRGVEDSSYGGHENREQEEINKHHGQAEEQASSALRQTKEPSHRIRMSYDPTCGSGGQIRLWLGQRQMGRREKQREEKCQGQARGKAHEASGLWVHEPFGRERRDAGIFPPVPTRSRQGRSAGSIIYTDSK